MTALTRTVQVHLQPSCVQQSFFEVHPGTDGVRSARSLAACPRAYHAIRISTMRPAVGVLHADICAIASHVYAVQLSIDTQPIHVCCLRAAASRLVYAFMENSCVRSAADTVARPFRLRQASLRRWNWASMRRHEGPAYGLSSRNARVTCGERAARMFSHEQAGRQWRWAGGAAEGHSCFHSACIGRYVECHL